MADRAQLRSNQLISTFGPGAMVDMPDQSVIIAGLRGWNYKADKPGIIHEPRLAAKIGKLQNPPRPTIELRCPPPAEDLRYQKGHTQPGVKGYIFPHWFIVQKVEITREKHRRRKLVLRDKIESNGKVKDERNVACLSVVPVRFVRACCKGHVGDIDWRRFAHKSGQICMMDLWFEERGTTGDLSELWVVCECGEKRCLRDAADRESKSLGKCNGSRPWLDDIDPNGCDQTNRLLQRNASNAYFPRLLPVISIPDSVGAVDKVVLERWDENFSLVESLGDVARERKRPSLTEKLQLFTDAALWESVQRIKAGNFGGAVERSVKDVEFEALVNAPAAAATDMPDGDFFARLLAPDRWQAPWLSAIERVVLVHRLREVTALVGFTRFDSAGPDISGELDINVTPAPLIDDPKWIPAVENRGEGIFVQFSAEAIASWREKPEVKERSDELNAGFKKWLKDHEGSKAVFPGVAYLMLHSLSHLLITAISLECGYPASSLRERIYAPIPGKDEMKDCYGILIFTGSSDAQGTLGGLVHAARDIRRHLTRACQLGSLCSNDPVCSSHRPSQNSGEELAGAACHGCLYISETSCEQFNRYLDRSLVVSTIDRLGCEFLRPPE